MLLPCLRCGRFLVSALIPRGFRHLELTDLICERCWTPHCLSAQRSEGRWRAAYNRDTRRYPSDCYDDIESPVVTLKGGAWKFEDDDSPFSHRGPIVVYKRKRFSRAQIRTIWGSSSGKCHLCGRLWRPEEHGSRGWHVDHVIPNVGGGRDTEMLENFLVACARCNLKKGRGYSSLAIREALSKVLGVSGFCVLAEFLL